MIDAATSDALRRIAGLEGDLRHAYDPGFVPTHGDVATSAPRSVPGGGPLAAVPPADAYFVIGGTHGTARLTRDGEFTLADGTLRTRDGSAVLGVVPGKRDIAPLRADPVDAALGRVAAAHVAGDGTVAYLRTTVDPRTALPRTERVVLGRIALARLPAGSLPVRPGDASVTVPPGVTPHLGNAGDGTFAPLSVGARDVGGLDPARGLQRLQEAYLSFEALQAAHHARGTVEKTTMDLLK